jgi:CelD/BcsL family acetyltransferase involved in cellulose biosynthesis
VKLKVYTEDNLFEQLEPEWNELLRRSTADNIFSTWEWQFTWWNAYRPGGLWVITCRDDDDRLVGIAPWFIDNDRSLSQIGCIDVTDYMDIIVDESNFEMVVDSFAEFLSEHKAEYDSIHLCNIPETSPTFKQLPNALEAHGFEVEVDQLDVCPLIELPDTWADYLLLLDKKHRHELRRKMRRANGSSEKIDWYTVDSSHDLVAEMERFLKLMAASDTEKQEFLQDEKNVEFFKQFAPLALENGWLQLNFLTVGGEAASTYLNFDYNNSIFVYNSGLLPDRYSYLSPGILLLAHNIRDAIEKGYSIFDFLRGDEQYKYHMGGKDTAIYMITA